jgi:hypothetical protein
VIDGVTHRPGHAAAQARRIAFRLGCASLIAVLVAASAPSAAAKQAAKQAAKNAPAKGAAAKSFPTPKAAVEALLGAVAHEDAAAALAVLGPAGKEIVYSGDPAADRPVRQAFVKAAEQRTVLAPKGKDVVVLEVGPEQWPFPIPIVKGAKGWSFDTAAGKQEILSRRIGRNELRVIALCRGFVAAEREYARSSAPGGGAGPYAERIVSSDGTHDGLYWPAKDGEAQSPLGPLAAEAARDGYAVPKAPGGGPKPFHGYFFKILTAQGDHAPGGAKGYVVDGKMTGGFALLAWPAEYRVSGVMTFIVNQDGIVFEKDLGPRTAALAPSIEKFDPDPSWRPSRS